MDANWRMGTKAMVIKSVPIDDMNIVVFAIRGSQTFMDWGEQTEYMTYIYILESNFFPQPSILTRHPYPLQNF